MPEPKRDKMLTADRWERILVKRTVEMHVTKEGNVRVFDKNSGRSAVAQTPAKAFYKMEGK